MSSFTSTYFLIKIKLQYRLCLVDTVYVAPIPGTALFLASAPSKGLILQTTPAWRHSFFFAPHLTGAHVAWPYSNVSIALTSPTARSSFSTPFMFRMPALPHAVSSHLPTHRFEFPRRHSFSWEESSTCLIYRAEEAVQLLETSALPGPKRSTCTIYHHFLIYHHPPCPKGLYGILSAQVDILKPTSQREQQQTSSSSMKRIAILRAWEWHLRLLNRTMLTGQIETEVPGYAHTTMSEQCWLKQIGMIFCPPKYKGNRSWVPMKINGKKKRNVRQ